MLRHEGERANTDRPAQRPAGQRQFTFPERPALREEWMERQVERLPLSETARKLLVVIGAHPMATREGETIRLQHESADLDAIARAAGIGERQLRNLRRELSVYHSILNVETFRTKRPPEWTIDARILIDAPQTFKRQPKERHPDQRLLFDDTDQAPAAEAAPQPPGLTLFGIVAAAIGRLVSRPSSGNRSGSQSGNAAPARKSSGNRPISEPISEPLQNQHGPPISGTLPDSPHTQSTCVGESNQRSTLPQGARGLSKKFGWGRDIHPDELQDGPALQALWELAVANAAPFVGQAGEIDRIAFFGFARYCTETARSPCGMFNAVLRNGDKFQKPWREKVRIEDEDWARRTIHELDTGFEFSRTPSTPARESPAEKLRRTLQHKGRSDILRLARGCVPRDSEGYRDFAEAIPEDGGLDAVDDELLLRVFSPKLEGASR